jgi:hypothetical protein
MSKSAIDMSSGASAANETLHAERAQAGDIHVLANNANTSTDGGLLHTIRKAADGSWLSFGDVKAVAGDPGVIWRVASATIVGQLHVLAATSGSDGGLFHAVRRDDGSWAAFRNITPEVGKPGEFDQVAAANVAGVLHVAAVTRADGSNFKLVHSIMTGTGAFLPFGDVEGQAGEAGRARDVALIALNGQLNLAAIFDAAEGLRILHTIRKSDGSWQPFSDVEATAGNVENPTRVALGVTSSSGSTLPSGLNLAVVAKFKLFHTIRLPNGSWLPFGDVEGQTGDIGGIMEVELTQSGALLHTFVTTIAVPGKGDLHHTIRKADGSWLKFGNVEGQAGEVGRVRSVGVSGA